MCKWPTDVKDHNMIVECVHVLLNKLVKWATIFFYFLCFSASKLARMCSAEWWPSTSRLREYVVSPSKCCPGSDLHDRPGSNSIGYALENGASILICRDGPIQESGLSLRSSPADSKLRHHRVPPLSSTNMVSMAWLMLMQMQQLVSGFSASSQRSNYFFLCFTRKKKKNCL